MPPAQRMNPPHNKSDPRAAELPVLIEACLRNERGAFRELVEDHQKYVFHLAFRVLHDEEDARDVVQETFLRVWRHLSEYDPRTKFTTWLYTIAVNLSYDQLKQKTRRRRWLLRFDGREDGQAERRGDEEMSIVNRDLAAKIKELADGLPPKQRMVFILRDLQDLSVEEVAEILSMSAGSVRANLCYARQCVRARMQQLEGMEGRTHEM